MTIADEKSTITDEQDSSAIVPFLVVKLNEEGSCSKLLQAQVQMMDQTLSFIKSATLKCAVQLGIPDVIHKHGKPMTLAELAQTLPINQAKSHFLYHLMRVLVNSGFFVQEKALTKEKEGSDDDDDATYALTPASRLFLKDNPLSARNFILFNLDPRILKPFQFLGDWFLNDDPSPFHTAYETGLWGYLEKDLILGSRFNELTAEDSRLFSKVLMIECKGVFEGLTSLVDIASGTGTTARAIAQTLPNLRCIVLDLPHVVANLNGSENLEFVGGDMFQAIPTANAILLKSILHNWSDEDCVKILKKCKEAIPSKDNGGKVIIIDVAMENKISNDSEAFEAQSFFDMLMVVLFGSKERTKKEWAKLFSDAGFSHYKVTPLLGLRSIIEAYP